MEDEDGYMSIDPTKRPHNHKPKGPPLRTPPPSPSLLWWKISVAILLIGVVTLTLVVIFLALPGTHDSFEWNNASNVIPSCQKSCIPCSSAKNSKTAKLTLNKATNNPNLYISDNLKSVQWKGMKQDLNSGPLRFDVMASVLSQECFNTGKLCWEVEVVDGGTWWGVGVSRESANRNGPILLEPRGGYWGVQRIDGQYQSITTPRTNLSLCHHPTRIRVSLDYSEGQVAFFDGDTDAELFSFPKTNFGGEKLCGWFLIYNWNGELTVYP